MLKEFPPRRDYSSLSVRDLIEARDAYHLHLMHLSNVTATAIGRYRIHENDWFATHPPNEPKPADFPDVKNAKTLYNTVVRPWSWPCVLVFVGKWLERGQFSQQPDQMVPRALFLPDGRVIPTCVVQVLQQDEPAAGDDAPSFPNSYIGGGFLLSTHVQGEDHYGSVGCLVSDGRSTFALTNQHVAGRSGEEVSSILRGTRVRVGRTADLSLRKLPFEKAYPGWPGRRAISNIDVGLVELDDLSLWTTQVAGLGPIGTPLDVHSDNITVDLIDCAVEAYGGASGPLKGRIAGLFYRYKSVGGLDYISDVIVMPDQGLTTRPGDSGTLWCLRDPDAELAEKLRPLALQWGGHVFVDEGKRSVAQGLALGTFLSTICRELDVDVVRGLNTGLPDYWGDLGHYTVGAKACQLLSHNTDLSELMMANLNRIAYGDENLVRKSFTTTTQRRFSPLADVPDKVWKPPSNPARRPTENANHFADMDKPMADGTTLLSITLGANGKTDPAKVSTKVFSDYYAAIKDRSRGLLPFRVWQLYDLMVEAVRDDDPAHFLAAAGVMAHYVGDSCQPLHISYKYNGDPDRENPDGDGDYGKGVHEAYESKMLRAHSAEILSRLNSELGIGPGQLGTHGYPQLCTSGHEAAVATVDVMRMAFQTISVDAIIDTFVADEGSLWTNFAKPTVQLLAAGSKALAMIWESAWIEGGSHIGDRQPVDENQLIGIYENPAWAPSVGLKDIDRYLR